MKWINLLLALALGVIFAVLAMFNDQTISFDYLLGKGEFALIVLLAMSFVAGCLMTLIIFGIKALYWKSRAEALHDQLHREHQDADHAEIEAQFRQDHQALKSA